MAPPMLCLTKEANIISIILFIVFSGGGSSPIYPLLACILGDFIYYLFIYLSISN